MSLLKHRERAPEVFRDWPFGPLSLRWFDDLFTDADGAQLIMVDEFTEDGTLVVRAEMPGLDPEKDVEITVEAGMLHITATRTEEEETTERDFRRREIRYGSYARTLPLPNGVDEHAVKASYKGGMLEVRVPMPTEPTKEAATRVMVEHG